MWTFELFHPDPEPFQNTVDSDGTACKEPSNQDQYCHSVIDSWLTLLFATMVASKVMGERVHYKNCGESVNIS